MVSESSTLDLFVRVAALGAFIDFMELKFRELEASRGGPWTRDAAPAAEASGREVSGERARWRPRQGRAHPWRHASWRALRVRGDV